jgi:catechol 2,3-dioxygenase-like lactoylglutathione lyase family enzyme
MGIKALDHIYVETHDWAAGTAFWKGLGFEFVDRWGGEGHRAGRLRAGDATVVLAEVEPTEDLEFDVFFSLEDADEYELADAVHVDRPLSDTHWGTRWIRVKDDAGRVFCLEESTEV